MQRNDPPNMFPFHKYCLVSSQSAPAGMQFMFMVFGCGSCWRFSQPPSALPADYASSGQYLLADSCWLLLLDASFTPQLKKIKNKAKLSSSNFIAVSRQLVHRLLLVWNLRPPQLIDVPHFELVKIDGSRLVCVKLHKHPLCFHLRETCAANT